MSERVKRYDITPTYQKTNGLILFDSNPDDLPLGFEAVEQNIVVLPPGQVGGNHAHSRIEAFVGFGEGLELHWRDIDGSHMEHMNPDTALRLFVVGAMAPHAIINRSHYPATVLEYASQPRTDNVIEPLEIIYPNSSIS